MLMRSCNSEVRYDEMCISHCSHANTILPEPMSYRELGIYPGVNTLRPKLYV